MAPKHMLHAVVTGMKETMAPSLSQSMMPAQQLSVAYFQWERKRQEAKGYLCPAAEFPCRRTCDAMEKVQVQEPGGSCSQMYDLRPGSPLPSTY